MVDTRGTVQEVGGLLGSLVQLSGLVVSAEVIGSVLAHLWSLLMLSFQHVSIQVEAC